MKNILTFFVVAIIFLGCNTAQPTKNIPIDSVHIYPTISYLNIKLDEAGRLPTNPYTLTFENGDKKIVFCGVNHLTDVGDIDNPMFLRIEQNFFNCKPNIAINEGGDISKNVYTSKKDALLKDGEIGLTKILCDSLKIKTIDGDPSFAFECTALLKQFSIGEMMAYIATERCMWGLKGQQITDTIEIEKRYNQFVQNYVIKSGQLTLTIAQQSFSFYKQHYQLLLNRPFNIKELEPTNPFEPNGKFQKIGRVSKEIRDQFLLQTIDKLLDTYNKIFIVFGGWHLLTCKPGLVEIVNRKRK
jgi:hypothetical protein